MVEVFIIALVVLCFEIGALTSRPGWPHDEVGHPCSKRRHISHGSVRAFAAPGDATEESPMLSVRIHEELVGCANQVFRVEMLQRLQATAVSRARDNEGI